MRAKHWLIIFFVTRYVGKELPTCFTQAARDRVLLTKGQKFQNVFCFTDIICSNLDFAVHSHLAFGTSGLVVKVVE